MKIDKDNLRKNPNSFLANIIRKIEEEFQETEEDAIALWEKLNEFQEGEKAQIKRDILVRLKIIPDSYFPPPHLETVTQEDIEEKPD